MRISTAAKPRLVSANSPCSTWPEVGASGSPPLSAWRIWKNDEQRGEQHAQRVAQARGEVVGFALQDVAGGEERHRRHAIAEQQPVEDRPGADVGAHDARVPREPAQHDDADGDHHIAEQRDAIDGRQRSAW